MVDRYVVERHAAAIITSDRAVEEWIALFDDPIFTNSALDRFAHRAHQIVMEGPSLRAARAPSVTQGARRSSKIGPDADSQVCLRSTTWLLAPSTGLVPPPGTTYCGVGDKKPCSERSRWRKQRSRWPSGWWKGFGNPLGERLREMTRRTVTRVSILRRKPILILYGS
ncbi:MAG: hypothetical protein DMD83_16080 [Candidatus Rokuibacteriota bacterium]|nr:MAG: hypothetical protein DMD83_16080 [Candidatus Rokubacteria bacterium]